MVSDGCQAANERQDFYRDVERREVPHRVHRGGWRACGGVFSVERVDWGRVSVKRTGAGGRKIFRPYGVSWRGVPMEAVFTFFLILSF